MAISSVFGSVYSWLSDDMHNNNGIMLGFYSSNTLQDTDNQTTLVNDLIADMKRPDFPICRFSQGSTHRTRPNFGRQSQNSELNLNQNSRLFYGPWISCRVGSCTIARCLPIIFGYSMKEFIF